MSLRIALVGCGRIAKRHSELLGLGQIEIRRNNLEFALSFLEHLHISPKLQEDVSLSLFSFRLLVMRTNHVN